ncbi:uracil phosphoribosyltransferase homolog isoform X2 [Cryptotermes secundus]|uniref:uracil phosphoribosyltransferase homolog isoform X2 n=1 Tax=Cryptotermes secundus TaxID=105785 RepID=UPI000CD7DB4F|nr:uracil phosphoribosyltransferase homolog isoform X2 [Cryptotermes secundus]
MGSAVEIQSVNMKLSDSKHDGVEDFGENLKVLPTSDQIKELQTILRDRNTTRSDFKFYADRLIRLVIEESLNQLPFSKCVVTTPTGASYQGLKYQKGNCGVSIVRSGEAMEQGLRDCCRSIRIGKILVESDADTHEARVVYARFPEDISRRKVLLMYPIMNADSYIRSSSCGAQSFWAEIFWHRLKWTEVSCTDDVFLKF